MKAELTISVRNLVEYILKSGDLEVGSFISKNRAKEGQRIHKQIQRSRKENYQSEIPVKKVVETDKFLLTIAGRIDGIFTGKDPVIIDEIKSVRSNLESYIKEENILHWGQARIYAYIYAEENKLSNIKVQLTYYELKTKKTEEVIKESTFDELKIFFDSIVNKYIIWMEKLAVREQKRNNSLLKLQFPHPEYRKGQKQLAVWVYKIVRESRQVLIQAPTGIGKTAAVLFPALKAMGEGYSGKIFFLSARTTGKQAAVKALQLLNKNEAQTKFIVLTAKEKICFKPEVECNRRRIFSI